jgi:hypothetical protein
VEILQQYAFRRPSTSQYAAAIEAIAHPDPNKRAFAVKLKRGEDFPVDAKTSTVQGGLSAQLRKALDEVPELRGRRPRTFVESDDVVVASLWPEGEGPKPRRASRRRERVAA